MQIYANEREISPLPRVRTPLFPLLQGCIPGLQTARLSLDHPSFSSLCYLSGSEQVSGPG